MGQMFLAGLALAAIVTVLAWTVVDSRRYHAPEPRVHLFDRDGHLIGATEELPVYTARHRARGRWSR